jgi:hypothetical protein
MKHVTQTPWTDEERAMLRRLRQNGVGLRACGTMMGRSYHSIQRQVRYLGLQEKVPQPQPEKHGSHDAGGGIRAGRTTLPTLPSLRDEQDPG